MDGFGTVRTAPATARLGRLLAGVGVSLVLLGCSGSSGKKYDISPIFPLSSDKCSTYNGKASGEGFGATCMVSKSDCERAAADWRRAMREGGVNDAILFTCD
jgi:hypothetical protein